MKIDGRTLAANVVALAGSPGWAALHTSDLNPATESSAALIITVQATGDNVFAGMVKKKAF
ncbi:hypothetical protein [Streptomyces sp. NPDC088748]|uniref:hypothetical protein n=1 Tax=Streptomyces sp. NPDC088748 TaxID=3365887 RepID=UPI003802E70B